MSTSPSLWFLAAAAGLPLQAAATVPEASAISVVYAGSTLVGDDRDQTFTQDFGSHRASHGGGQARASLSLGADLASVPFIAFSAAASGQSFAGVDGQLIYHWAVEGVGAEGELIPVTIATLGWMQGRMTARSLQADEAVDASVNWLGMGVSSHFSSYVEGGLDFRSYGRTAGNRNMGVTPVDLGSLASSLPGGSVTASGETSFSDTFTLWVQPNLPHTIRMEVTGGVGNVPFYNDTETAHYSWSLSGYIDPVITIDPAYASRFSVVQSDIPMVPVPESSTWALLLAGLGLVAGVTRRRRTAD